MDLPQDPLKRVFEQAGGDRKRLKLLERKAQAEAEADPTTTPEALFIVLKDYDTAEVDFKVVWWLVVKYPDLVRAFWSDDYFRRRVLREFPDEYYAVLAPGSREQMHEDEQSRLLEMSRKSKLPPYSALSEAESRLPWFLLYQKMRRLAVLFREHSEQTVSLVEYPLWVRMEFDDVDIIAWNGPWVLRGIYDAIGIIDYQVVHWVSNAVLSLKNLRSRDGDEMVLWYNGRSPQMTLTLGKLVMLQRDPVDRRIMIVVVDLISGSLLPENTAEQRTRAKQFGAVLLQFHSGKQITSPANSTLVQMGTNVFNPENYADFLSEALDESDVLSSHRTIPQLLQGDRLYKNYSSEITNFAGDWKQVVPKLPTKVFGPHYAISNSSPYVFLWSAPQYTLVEAPALPADATLRGLDWEENTYSSVLYTGGIALQGWVAYVHHMNGFTIGLDFSNVVEENNNIQHIAGSRMVAMYDTEGRSNDTPYVRFGAIDLYASLEPNKESLLRAPCEHCALPGVMRCGSCKANYCSDECAAAHQPLHQRHCRV